jgi:hypothetical protein
MSGRLMSSVTQLGMYSRASCSAAAPRAAMSTLNPLSCATSIRSFAKFASFSTTSTTESPGWMLSASSSKALGPEDDVGIGSAKTGTGCTCDDVEMPSPGSTIRPIDASCPMKSASVLRLMVFTGV